MNMKRFIIPLILFLLILLNSCNTLNLNIKSEKNSEASTPEKPSGPPQIEGMAYIPGGWFEMGSRRASNERPVHRVFVKPFYLDIKEVTVFEFRQFCNATRRKMPKQPEWSSNNHPVVNVTWYQAKAYAKWAGKRLPTEAEWEFAARGGENSGLRYSYQESNFYGNHYGNVADESIRRLKGRFPSVEGYDDGYEYTAPVGSFISNTFGVFDMDGNVLEWCSDWYSKSYYKQSPAENPKGPAQGRYKVIRGGSWNRSGKYLRVTYRTFYHPKVQFNFVGFRCAKDAPEPPAATPMVVADKEK